MKRRLGVLLALITTITLVLTAVGPTRAAAAPVATPNMAGSSGWITTKASKAQWLTLRLAAKTLEHNRSRTLDYRTAIKYFKTSTSNNTSYRRGFAAGWYYAGGSISHISASEMSKIRAQKKGTAPYAVAPMKVPGTNCTGKGHAVKTIVVGKEWREWFNSCETSDLINNFGWVPWTSGAVSMILAAAKALPGYEYVALLVGAVALLSQHQIAHAQAESKYNAIVVTTKDIGSNPTNGTRYIDHIVEPQNGQYG